jgi:hypothetical protein
MGNAFVSRCGNASVFLMDDGDSGVIRVLFKNRCRIVAGTVIDYDQLPIEIRLREHTAYCFGDKFFAVIDR